MRIGIIDLGTNSVRFDIHQIGPGRIVRQLHREKLMVRLGQGVFIDGKLDREAVRRTIQAFISFKSTASELQADKIIAFGTSALREAADGERLLNLIREKTGIEVRVISGAEEARLIALGVLSRERGLKGRFALVDIGGGSTEISICRASTVLNCESFPLGVARLQQVFLKSTPPKAKDIDELRRFIRGVLLSKFIAEEWPKVDRSIGSSGTIRVLARILKKVGGGGKTIDRGDLKKLVKQMSTMTTTQLLGLPGMEAKRVDMILAGGILLEECLQAIGAKKAITTDYSLRDGILEEQIELVRQHKDSQLSLRVPDLYDKARRLQLSETHLKHVVDLSEALFDRLRPLHKLRPHWKIYLTAAAILHDVGEAVSPTQHEKHSYYIVKNADFPSTDAWETEFIAQLCLRHRSGKVEDKDLPFKRSEKNRIQAFKKLLALLRVADALDRSHQKSLAIKSIRVLRKSVKIQVRAKGSVDLEILRVEQKKDLFEQVFRKTLIVEKA